VEEIVRALEVESELPGLVWREFLVRAHAVDPLEPLPGAGLALKRGAELRDAIQRREQLLQQREQLVRGGHVELQGVHAGDVRLRRAHHKQRGGARAGAGTGPRSGSSAGSAARGRAADAGGRAAGARGPAVLNGRRDSDADEPFFVLFIVFVFVFFFFQHTVVFYV
jgi:hypothetical protein